MVPCYALLYLSINISRCIQKPIELVWCTCEPRLYDETHKIQIALITKCGLYAHGSLLSLLYLSYQYQQMYPDTD